MTKYLDALRNANGIHGVAALVGFSPKNLAYIIYGIPDEAKYSVFSIPKKSGGTRQISSPIPKLKLVQSRLAEHLTKCLTEIEVSENVKPSCTLSHGFKPKLSISTNAANHTGKRWVLNVDLADFFPSVHFGRVRGYFIKNKYFALEESTATLLSQIICHQNSLPQGAPTSPIVSNLIASNLDIALNRLARRHRCTYTRYADDLSFSSNKKEFSDAIALTDANANHRWMAGNDLRYQIQRSGFVLNASKTRMQLRWSRQDVTGLIVNEKVNIPREYVRSVRAKCEHLFRGKQPFKNGAKGEPAIDLSVNHVQGMLAHILRIKRSELEFKRPKDWKEAPGYLVTHRKFLDYINYVSQKAPTILCEGETDNIYIRCALRALDTSYPNMISDDGKKTLLVKLYRYTKTADIVHGLAGGTGDLKELIHSYHRRLTHFSTQKPKQPTIIVVDNDQGSKGKQGVFAAAKSISNLPVVDGSQQFYYIIDNLYLVPTPRLPPATESMIEDFIEPSIKKRILNGKTLNLDQKTFDPKKHYGKVAFAKNVVRQGADAIDFSGYQTLLDAINAAIEDYKVR